MDDSTLHVEPAVVRAGATSMNECGDQMGGVLRAVATLHDDLLDVWTGPAARDSESGWSDAEAMFSKHVRQLTGHSEALHAAVNKFEGTDETNGEGFLNV